MGKWHLTRPILEEKIWGGEQIPQLMSGIQNPPQGKNWGEAFILSSLKNALTSCQDLKMSPNFFPYVVKLIDTAQNLSIQVHPDDAYALSKEKDQGKNESWLILKAAKGSGVYLGVKEGVTKEQFFSSVEKGKDLTSLLNFFPVNSGDFFYVPAGTVHAIGAGLSLLEVQQSSGITYRVWDWNRLDSNGEKRSLHIEDAKAVINFDPAANKLEHFRFANNIWAQSSLGFFSEKCFSIGIIHLKQNEELSVGCHHRDTLVVVQGKMLLSAHIEQKMMDPFKAYFSTDRSRPTLIGQDLENVAVKISTREYSP